MMSVYGLPPMFLAASVLLCADPLSAHPEDADLSTQIEELASTSFQVVASSPLAAEVHPGSEFGYRISPRTHRRTFHAGADFLAPRGTPVFAVQEGVVEAVAHEGRTTTFAGYGNAIVVYHPETNRWSFYAHLDEALVQVGQRVEPGMLIGRVGNTTNRRFPGMPSHLHFEVRVPRPDGGSPFPGAYRRHNIDPVAYLESLGVRYDYEQEGECIVRGGGEADAAAPMLVVREVSDAPVRVASASSSVTTRL